MVRATLLLAHARTQALNQKRLEVFLASCAIPNLDLSRRLSGSITPRARSSNRYMSPPPARGQRSGADTPRDLNSRVKILELYTLHVLRKNKEWECAREFITASPFLDEERREAFLMALQSLQELDEEEERKEREEAEEEQERVRREVEEARRLRVENEAREQERLQEERRRRQQGQGHAKRRSETGSEIDYGIEGAGTASSPRSSNKTVRPPAGPKPALSRPGARKTGPGTGSRAGPIVPATLGETATLMMRRLQGVIDQLATSLRTNPAALMKIISFIVMLLLMFARRDLRERIQRIVAASWAKVKATAGMGVKVSYI
jgi:hypothetical protein